MSLDIYDNDYSQPDSMPLRRPYLCIMFECCRVYARVYRRPNDSVYRGRCPKCLRAIQLRVGPDGTAARFFRAH